MGQSPLKNNREAEGRGKMKNLIILLTFFPLAASASSFAGFDSILLWMVFISLLGIESFLIMVCFFCRVLFIPKVRTWFNFFTTIFVVMGWAIFISFISAAGFQEFWLLLSILVASCIIPIVVPNKFQKFERKKRQLEAKKLKGS